MHTELLNYAIRSTACLAFFYAFYSLILRKETCFGFNRSYLLTTLLLSFILPVLKISFQIPADITIDPTVFILPEVIISDTVVNQSIQSSRLFNILNIIYFSIAILLTSRLSIRLLKLWNLINSNRHLREEKFTYKVIPTNGEIATSSFLDYLFWDNSNSLNEQEKNKVISHEKVHILERHSYDILLIEFCSIIFWFNPFVWLWKSRISENHEYLADAKVAQQLHGYSDFLARHTLAINGFDMIHQFKSSEVINRLRMLQKLGQKTKSIKILAIIPLAAFMIFTMSFSVERIIDESSNSIVKYQTTNIETKASFIAFESQDTNPIVQESTFDSDLEDMIIPHEIPPMPSKDLAQLKSIKISEHGREGEVFTVVEESATPINGMPKFYKYVAKNIKYPKQAQKENVWGKVYVEFVIDKKGVMTELKVLKGIGAGCDQEALRVLANAPNWKPGKQRGKAVKQKIVLPIVFKLR